jgi:hypothetical protein
MSAQLIVKRFILQRNRCSRDSSRERLRNLQIDLPIDFQIDLQIDPLIEGVILHITKRQFVVDKASILTKLSNLPISNELTRSVKNHQKLKIVSKGNMLIMKA